MNCQDLALLAPWLAACPHWKRTPLSRERSSAWNWRNAAGGPAVPAPPLCSHWPGRVTARLSADGQDKSGPPICQVETFVERARFRGVGYRAAGWQPVGLTTGGIRNDERNKPIAPVKEVSLQALGPDGKGGLAR